MMLIALRTIHKDEMITFNKLTTEWSIDSNYAIKCKCDGSPCYGFIQVLCAFPLRLVFSSLLTSFFSLQGFKHLTYKARKGLEDYLTPFLTTKFAECCQKLTADDLKEFSLSEYFTVCFSSVFGLAFPSLFPFSLHIPLPYSPSVPRFLLSILVSASV
jgi:hypothetical protein